MCIRDSYKHPTKKEEHNNGSENSDYGDAVVPVAPVPMMSSNPIYGSEPNMYTNGPSPS